MSSLWPLPIGTIASIDLSPICTGWSTDCLAITPGATTSIGAVCFVLSSPFPSIGFPRASTTRPSISSPTGTSKILPVHVTFCPSLSPR